MRQSNRRTEANNAARRNAINELAAGEVGQPGRPAAEAGGDRAATDRRRRQGVGAGLRARGRRDAEEAPPAARIGAATAILDRGYGKALLAQSTGVPSSSTYACPLAPRPAGLKKTVKCL